MFKLNALESKKLLGGHSSVVERLVANEKVEGSTPFARSMKMNDLLDKKCKPCEGGVAALNLQEIHKYQKKLMVGM